MKQTISFEKYKKSFDDYASHYDRNDGRVELKIIHTRAVVAIMEQLCRLRRLPEHTFNLALLCAQFHDIGRFEQLRQYSTFIDHISVNHAVLSCQVLEENGILDDLLQTDKKKILTAIANHNKLEIDPSIVSAAEHADNTPSGRDAKECLELCKLIRDADKCDIFRVFAVDDMMDVVGAPDSQIAEETITPAVLQSIREHRCIDKVIRETYLDQWISFIGYFFDLNYPESMQIAREQGYYRVPFDRTEFVNPETRMQVEEALDIIEQYISHFAETIPDALRTFFKTHPSLALAFSGGTDSAYLLYAAKACGCNIHAYYASSPFQPAFELEDARRLAESLKADMTVLSLNVLENETVRKNPKDRCYHCKNEIFTHILEAAAKDGYREIIDGTNASDDAGDRPGMRALRELKVLSPLRECGITKKALREYSRNAGLFTWNKPAYACLATRIPVGTEIEPGILQKVEWAEAQLSRMGFTDFRVRVFPDPAVLPPLSAGLRPYAAKLQITDTQLPLFVDCHSSIFALLKQEFSNVLLDLELRKPSV